MDFKTLGVAAGSVGAIAILSILRSKSSSLAEEEAPETKRAVAPEVVHRYDLAYSKFLQSERVENYHDFYRSMKKLAEAREKLEEALQDVVKAEEAIDGSHNWLDKINFQSGYVDDVSEVLRHNEPWDIARMKAYRAFVLGLDWESAQKFAELAGEKSPQALFQRWAP